MKKNRGVAIGKFGNRRECVGTESLWGLTLSFFSCSKWSDCGYTDYSKLLEKSGLCLCDAESP